MPCCSVLDAVEFRTTVKLIERFFGDFEGSSNVHYEDVWRDDQVLAPSISIFILTSY